MKHVIVIMMTFCWSWVVIIAFLCMKVETNIFYWWSDLIISASTLKFVHCFLMCICIIKL